MASASGRGRPRGPQKPAARPDTRLGESKREKSRSESPSGETAREGGEKAIIFTTFNLISFYTKIPRGSEEEEH